MLKRIGPVGVVVLLVAAPAANARVTRNGSVSATCTSFAFHIEIPPPGEGVTAEGSGVIDIDHSVFERFRFDTTGPGPEEIPFRLALPAGKHRLSGKLKWTVPFTGMKFRTNGSVRLVCP